MIGFLKRMFCNHKWEYERKIEPFFHLAGDAFIVTCKKCGKQREAFFTHEEQQMYKELRWWDKEVSK